MNPGWLFFNNITITRPMFGLEDQTFIDMLPLLVSFIVFALLMSYLLYKPIRNLLQNRSTRVEGDLSEAALSKASAAELKLMYEQKVRDIELERETILSEAHKQASDKRSQMLSEAKSEAQDVKDRAARDIVTEREQIKSAIVESIVEISADMAARLITSNIDKSAHDKLFAEALAELEATTAFKTDAVA